MVGKSQIHKLPSWTCGTEDVNRYRGVAQGGTPSNTVHQSRGGSYSLSIPGGTTAKQVGANRTQVDKLVMNDWAALLDSPAAFSDQN